ncbi:MAG: glucosaminidase domain-containing protein [Bacteroidetes bacterium]|nr:glucosaminidase domain-containing protein [Bacteroidota bacterium]MBP6315641.1 glucosaminidase domain-containing protein [Chitinophagaceae bacterium]
MIKKILTCFASVSIFCCQHVFAQNENDILAYIDKFKGFAIEEQNRVGVPAAITLAQGIHETAAGKSELATEANNHFGIKCKANWTGETFLHDDDKKQECFRKYLNAQQSYIDHSDFLKAGSRYAFLFELEITDYVSWAAGLKRAGYATNPLYVKRLTDLVEKYNLQQYTYDGLRLASTKPKEVIPNVDAKNPDIIDDPNLSYKGLKGFWAAKGDNLQEKATQNNIKYARLLEFNDLPDKPLENDMFLFTERKKKIGTVEFHLVKEGETMQLISQKEAMSLDNLYQFNNLKREDMPHVGEQLSLQYRSYGTPKLVAKAVSQEVVPVPVEAKSTQEVPEVAKPAEAPVQTTTNGDIKDLAKAKKVESILTGNPESKSEIQITQTPATISTTAEVKTETLSTQNPILTKETEKTTIAEIKKEEAQVVPKVEKKPVAVAPKRTYNEKGVSDSVKMLKEKFDNLVYRPFERRPKPVQPTPAANPKTETQKVVTPTAIVTKSSSGITKELTPKNDTKPNQTAKDSVAKKPASAKELASKKSTSKKDSVSKKTTPKADTVRSKVATATEPKNTNVEKTKTGIVRDVKKMEEERKKAKEAALKAKEAADAKKKSGKGAPKKKENKK